MSRVCHLSKVLAATLQLPCFPAHCPWDKDIAGTRKVLSLTLFHRNYSELSALTLSDSSTAVAGAGEPDGLGSVQAALTAAIAMTGHPAESRQR